MGANPSQGVQDQHRQERDHSDAKFDLARIRALCLRLARGLDARNRQATKRARPSSGMTTVNIATDASISR
jgi:hypothetical protein